MLRRLEEFLGAHGASYESVTHPEALTAVLPACCAIDVDRLKGLIGLGEIELASIDEIRKTFPGCEMGAVPPFGRLFGVPTFVEEALVDQREIAMAAGDRRSAIRMRATEYVRLAESRHGQFAVHEGETFPVHPKPRARTRKPVDYLSRVRGGVPRRARP